MSEIRITAYSDIDGASVPARLTAAIGTRHLPNDAKVPILRLFLGQDEVQIWPADRTRLLELAESIRTAAESLRR